MPPIGVGGKSINSLALCFEPDSGCIEPKTSPELGITPILALTATDRRASSPSSLPARRRLTRRMLNSLFTISNRQHPKREARAGKRGTFLTKRCLIAIYGGDAHF
jgi:hypothetical protein